MKIKLTLIMLAFTFCQYGFAQEAVDYKSWNPIHEEGSYVGGQAWQDELQNPYDRFPARAEKQVRDAVWNLSKNSAGLVINFRTDAPEIIVKYAVSGRLDMPHMPATGVSGVDLYAKDEKGKWIWSAGKYSFGDTITYRFVNLNPSKGGRDYTLYLPLYNTVKWMEIHVPENNLFVPSLPKKEKQIVVYGTSIAQGACATRPGLAWTNILGRKLDHPILNLAFSGNGKLETEVLTLIAEKDARVFVLDCLPNLTDISSTELKKRVNDAVVLLRSKQPGTPILLTEHDGYTDEAISQLRKEQYQSVNIALKEVYDSLLRKGIQGLYLLSKEEINQDIESMVDGVHPNDIGMMKYADAYEKKLIGILNDQYSSAR